MNCHELSGCSSANSQELRDKLEAGNGDLAYLAVDNTVALRVSSPARVGSGLEKRIWLRKQHILQSLSSTILSFLFTCVRLLFPPKMRLIPAPQSGRRKERPQQGAGVRKVTAKTSRCGRQPTNSRCQWEW